MVSGPDLRAARLGAKVSLDALSTRIGMSKGHLSRVERGQREATPALLRGYQ
ncbi:helix-turn-helix domain-containing protein [Streptosporangium sp. V21-05]|uniref:helix-turn-helix domain-containing protein n=1 Tax=Streptosporangium sp. V21-05 TaxID=3446115 RepID=UPI003F52BCB3